MNRGTQENGKHGQASEENPRIGLQLKRIRDNGRIETNAEIQLTGERNRDTWGVTGRGENINFFDITAGWRRAREEAPSKSPTLGAGTKQFPIIF